MSGVQNRRFIVGVGLMLAVPTLLIAAAAAWLISDVNLSPAQLETIRQRAESEGIPTSPEAFIMTAVIGEDMPMDRKLATLHKAWRAIPPETQRALQTASRQRAMGSGKTSLDPRSVLVLGLLRQAGATSQGRTDWASHEATEARQQEGIVVLETGRLLTNEAMAKIRNGQVSSGFSDLMVLRRIGRAYADHGGMAGLQLQAAFETQALTAAQSALIKRPNSPEVRAAYRAFIQHPIGKVDLLRAAQGDAMWLSMAYASSDERWAGTFTGSAAKQKMSDEFRRATASRLLEFWILAYPAMRAEGDDIYAMRRILAEQVRRLESARAPSQLMVQVLGRRALASVDQAQAVAVRHRQAAVLLAVVQYFDKHGKWPSAINNLGINIEDPLAEGGAFGYRIDAEKLEIISYGADGEDDEGQPRMAANQPGDLICRIESGGASNLGY